MALIFVTDFKTRQLIFDLENTRLYNIHLPSSETLSNSNERSTHQFYDKRLQFLDFMDSYSLVPT